MVSGLYLFEGVQQGNRTSVGACYDSLGILESQSNNSRMNHCGGNATATKKVIITFMRVIRVTEKKRMQIICAEFLICLTLSAVSGEICDCTDGDEKTD